MSTPTTTTEVSNEVLAAVGELPANMNIDKLAEWAGKLEAFIVAKAPAAWDMLSSLIQMWGVWQIAVGLFCAIATFAIVRVWLRCIRTLIAADKVNDEMNAILVANIIGFVLLPFASIPFFIGTLDRLLSFKVWLGVFSPELFLIYPLLGKLF